MFRTLTIIAAAGLVLAAACFGGAVALGGADIARQGWTLHGPMMWNFRWLDGEDDQAWDGPETTREIPWSADRELIFFQSGDVRYTQGPKHKMLVTGPASAVNRLRMTNGRLTLDTGPFGLPTHLKIEVTAPDVDRFRIFGSSRLAIEGYDQDRLGIEINGNGDVTSAGKARTIDVTIRGSGDVDVSRTASAQTRVEILGSGDTTIAPTDSADIVIAGSGDVTLLSDPPHVTTDIKGAGNVMRRVPPPGAQPSAEPPAPTGKPI